MAKKEPPIIEIDLKKNGGKFSFASTDEINKWISKEIDYFSWIQECRSKHSNIQFIAEKFFLYINELRTPIQQSANNPSQLISYLTNFKQLAEEYYANNKLIHSLTAKAKFIDSLMLENDIVAAHAFGYFISEIGSINYLSKLSYEGFFKAMLFEEGKHTEKSEAAALDQLKLNFSDYLLTYKAEADALENQLSVSIEKADLEKQEALKKHSELLEFHQQEFLMQLEASKLELRNIEEAYDKKMALQASITYWEGRESHHQTLARKFSIAAVIVLLIGLYIVTFSSFNLLNFELHSLSKNANFSLITHVPLWKISIIILLFSLFIWIERILVRLILSNLHLETDAGERVVMAKTYIALLREGNAPKDEDRKLILASLFRPNATGIISDDAMPFNLDKMQNIVSGR